MKEKEERAAAGELGKGKNDLLGGKESESKMILALEMRWKCGWSMTRKYHGMSQSEEWFICISISFSLDLQLKSVLLH